MQFDKDQETSKWNRQSLLVFHRNTKTRLKISAKISDKGEWIREEWHSHTFKNVDSDIVYCNARFQ